MSAPQRLQGTKLELPYPSVGTTEQVLLTAVRAEGVTELRNAAIEPEIMDLIAVLQKMGAIISVDTDRVIRVEGVEQAGRLHPPRAPGPDRGRVLGVRGAGHRRATSPCSGRRQLEMMTFLNVFRKVGGLLDVGDDGIRFCHPGGSLNSLVLETAVHPGS